MAPRIREISRRHEGWRSKERDEGANNGVEERETHQIHECPEAKKRRDFKTPIALQRNLPSARGMAPRTREISRRHERWRSKERDEGANNGVEERQTHQIHEQ